MEKIKISISMTDYNYNLDSIIENEILLYRTEQREQKLKRILK